MSRLADVVNELCRFVEDLKARPDVVVTTCELGAGVDVPAGSDLPDELVELYRLMNGVHIEWHFVEPDGGGTMRIPPFSAQWTRFEGDERTYLRLGDRFEALFFDEITPEGPTWLVREKASKQVTMLFGRAEDGIQPASSIAEYLERAMASGFGHWWPACFRNNRWVSYAAQERTIERFRAPPVLPTRLEPGRRVHLTTFSEGGRGQLRELRPFPEGSNHEGQLALVHLDLGPIVWLDTTVLKAHDTVDAYERLRAVLPGPTEPLPVLEELARAIGPHTFSSPIGPSNARPAAGIVMAHGLASSIELLLWLYDATIKARLPFDEALPLPQTGDELSPDEVARMGWTHRIRGTFTGLIGGLTVAARAISADSQRSADQLIDAALRTRLKRCGMARDLHALLGEAQVLEGMELPKADPARAGLSADATYIVGTGF